MSDSNGFNLNGQTIGAVVVAMAIGGGGVFGVNQALQAGTPNGTKDAVLAELSRVEEILDSVVRTNNNQADQISALIAANTQLQTSLTAVQANRFTDLDAANLVAQLEQTIRAESAEIRLEIRSWVESRERENAGD